MKNKAPSDKLACLSTFCAKNGTKFELIPCIARTDSQRDICSNCVVSFALFISIDSYHGALFLQCQTRTHPWKEAIVLVVVVVVVAAREKWFEVIWLGEEYAWCWLWMIEKAPFSKDHLVVVVVVVGRVVV
jgi:hypothetical protein